MNKKINYTINNNVLNAGLKTDNNNSGDDIIMPMLNDYVKNSIIEKNQLVSTGVNNKDITEYKSLKFPETTVTFYYNHLVFTGRLFVSTFLRVDIPKGYDFDIRNRSGNFKKNINIICGLIDEPYTGEMGMQIATISNIPTKLEFTTQQDNVRYAQLKLNKYYKRRFEYWHVIDFIKLKSTILKDKIRGVNGFGSSGK